MKVKRLLLPVFIVTVLCLLFAGFFSIGKAKEVFADSYYDEESDEYIIDTNYWFQNIEVNVDVRRDKTFAITEKMKVGFLRENVNTGIIRDIQRVSTTTRVIDGERVSGDKYIANLTDVSAMIDGVPARVTQSLYSNGNFHSVKMQKQDESYFPATADQKNDDDYHVFELSYVYDMSADKAEGYDDFTFDVLGYAMAFTRRFKAEITFPETLEENNVTFRTNGKKNWQPNEKEGEYIRIEGNKISLYARPFSDNKGYTVQVLLPDGYFAVTGKVPFLWYYGLCAGIAALSLPLTVFLFLKFRTRKPVESVEFYPPEGMRPARYSAVWHGRMRKKDLSAVVLLWAKEGYVSIEKDGRKDILLTRLKELPPDTDEEEREYFDALFTPIFSSENGEGEVFSSRAMQTGMFYEKGRKISQAADAAEIAANWPDPLAKGRMAASIGILICSLIPIAMMLVYLCAFHETALPVLFLVFIVAGTATGYVELLNSMSPLMYVFPVAFMGMPLVAVITIFYLPAYDYIGFLWISVGWWALCFFLPRFMKRRTPEAQRDYGKMRGFRRFLLTAELSRIERVLLDNPDYYYDVIPYCLVMGIGKKVEKRFKPLQLALPEWANGVSLGSLSSCLSHSFGSSGGGGGGGGGGGSSGGGGGGGGSRGC